MTCLNAPPTTRLKIAVRGAVQGVGFRPFVHRLAAELGLAGWVNNSSQGVFIEAEGSRACGAIPAPPANGEAAAQFHPQSGILVAGRGGVRGF